MGNRRLAGKIATVVGAGSRGEPAGTGYATAMLFAQEGAKVLLVDIDRERAEVTLKEITSAGGEASVFQADVTSEAACQDMIAACVEQYGGLDILFNNVAIHGSGMVTEVDAAYLDHTFNINLKSMMLAV